eukprot:1157729-Pelagomonas_calceolata.AAC.6
MQGALFEQQHLPEDPFEFIKAHVDGQRNVLEGEGLQASYQQPPEPSPSITTLAPAIQVTPKEQERPGGGCALNCVSPVCVILTLLLACRSVLLTLSPRQMDLEPAMSSFCMNHQRESAKHVPKYAPFSHLKRAHSQPLHLIGTILALKSSWRWAKAHTGHVNPNSVLFMGKWLKTPHNTNHWVYSLHLFWDDILGGQTWSFGVKYRVHAAAD